MVRLSALAAWFLLVPAHLRADDGISPATVTALKRATVFVRVEGAGWKATGSGFVVAADKDSVLVATNHHVVALPENEKRRLSPTELVRSLKVPTVTAVFDSGTRAEVSARAEVLAADPFFDLAVLRVTGLKDPPAPIDTATPVELVETMSVYTFGFPFGEALATGNGNPNVTVGKGSVSSLRNDENGDLLVVQINGALNPGNSGGPVVDAKGRLVGVAVATLKNSQGIGFAVPSAELGKVMKGRVGGVHLLARSAGEGKLAVKAEAGLVDPGAAVRGVTLHYLVVPPNGEKPKAGLPLAQHKGVRTVDLKVDGGVAAADLTLTTADGELYVQAVPEGGAGAAGASRLRAAPLQTPKGADPVALGVTTEPEETDPVRPVGPPTRVPVSPFAMPNPPTIPAFPGRSFPAFPGRSFPSFPTIPPIQPIMPIRPIGPPSFPTIPGFPANPRPLFPNPPSFPNPTRPVIPGFPGRP
ncbi:S1C family serine protease [Gemmata sp.]|uniref:S1C family serine protease n=1 Tax=Gemmata sp. TaxID=1914242 RepID=UPI003F71C3C2